MVSELALVVEQDGAAGQVRELIRQFREIKKKEEEDAREVEGAWRSYTRVWEKKKTPTMKFVSSSF